VKTSLFEIFKIGIGPSSSHTVGPMRAAAAFATGPGAMAGCLRRTARGRGESLWFRLALTGPWAPDGSGRLLLGLSGEFAGPELRLRVIEPKLGGDPDGEAIVIGLERTPIAFDEARDFVISQRQDAFPFHSNGMRFIGHSMRSAV